VAELLTQLEHYFPPSKVVMDKEARDARVYEEDPADAAQ